MADHRKLIAKLAQSPSVAAASHDVAERIVAEAKRIDPDGDFAVEDTVLVVNGLPRRSSRAVNRDPDGGRVEFASPSGREGSDGRSGLRPLGRAARMVR